MDAQKDTVKVLTAVADLRNSSSTTVCCDLGKLDPGFYQVNVSCKGPGGEAVAAPFNIGVDPEKIVSPQDKKDDFDAFWAANLAELATVAPEYKLTLLPEKSSAVRNVYRVEMKSLGGASIGGIYAEPVKPGKYPVYIEYMGYGADPYYFDPDAMPEAIQFLVSVRDQGIFKANNERWIDRGLDSKENFYYRGAFCDVVRAIDFAASREKADTDHLFAQGESQGGAFTWIAASLDSRIKAIAPAVPFLSDYRDYSRIVWWPMWEMFETADKESIDKEAMFQMLSYFDIKNFTDRIKCPVYMAFGLQDPTCPPHTNFAGYNQVKSEKKYFCSPLCGHAMWMVQEWSQLRSAWFNSLEN